MAIIFPVFGRNTEGPKEEGVEIKVEEKHFGEMDKTQSEAKKERKRKNFFARHLDLGRQIFIFSNERKTRGEPQRNLSSCSI